MDRARPVLEWRMDFLPDVRGALAALPQAGSIVALSRESAGKRICKGLASCATGTVVLCSTR